MPADTRSFIRLLIYALLIAILWLVLSGHSEPFILALGSGSVVLVVWLARRMGLIDDEGLPLQQLPRVLGYFPWLFWQIIVSNIDVARRILSPSLPISPTEIDVPSGQSTDMGRATLANSITLTPGTVSMWVRDESIHVHALSREAAEELMRGEMARRVARLEGGE